MENPFSRTCSACYTPVKRDSDRAISKLESLLDLSQLNPGFVILSPRICLCHRLTKRRTQTTEHQKMPGKLSLAVNILSLLIYPKIQISNPWKFTQKVVLAVKPLKCEFFVVDKLEVSRLKYEIGDAGDETIGK